MAGTSRESGRKGGLTSPTVPSPEDFKNPLKVEDGRKCGLRTREKYGVEWLREKGKLGGRPRARSYIEITEGNTCRFCGQPLTRSGFNRRYYVYVCSNSRCHLFRQPQRNETYAESRQQQRLEQNNNNHKEVMGPPGKNLRTLNAHYKLRRRSTGIDETPQAGTAQETPREQVPAGKEAR